MADDRQTMIDDIVTSHQQILRTVGALTPSAWMNIDLSMAQLKTLMALYNCGALPIGQIAEMLGIGPPTASHLVDRLVQAQLVSRTEDTLDRRRTLAQLSPDGEALAGRLNQVRFAPLRRWLAQLGDADLAAFHQGSRALAEVARSQPAGDPEAS